MADCISRDMAVEILRPYKIDPFKIGFFDDEIAGFNDGIDTAISCISTEVPAADVRPVVHGKWENTGSDVWKCSICCYGVMPWNAGMNYCPNCGADMREA